MILELDQRAPITGLKAAIVGGAPSLLSLVNEHLINRKFKRELKKFTKKAWNELGEGEVFLFEVKLFYDQLDNIHSSGQIIKPIGLGASPVNAYALYYMQPQLTQSDPSGLRLHNYFLYLERKNKKINVAVIPHEFTGSLYSAARREATRIASSSTMPPAKIMPKDAQTADYWIKRYENNKDAVIAAGKEAEFGKLLRLHQELSVKLEDVQREYRDAIKAASRQSKRSQLMILGFDIFDEFVGNQIQAPYARPSEEVIHIFNQNTTEISVQYFEAEYYNTKNELLMTEESLGQIF
ncbi:MAG: hypothetical protein HKN50_02625 [Gammaproteobacteria bacterium]|nr:hypothetical protein [Gammaproteobacteria bacterium]